MARRPSIQTVFSSEPHVENSQLVQLKDSAKEPERLSHLRTFSPFSSKFPLDSFRLDPDELFTKYTVAEVKLVQKKLRADADAKQEELRSMVGERYRDLLQASTSIISLARSAARVKEALEEAKEAILKQEAPSLPAGATIAGNDVDAHLHALQLLSAHIKLLLDAPEHLWRLIEKRRYFAAAWLFLLSRVVYRVLVRDEQDEAAWKSQGINVLDEFPLVQRQWEAVSQFRSQIIYKATFSLREFSATSEDACAALLTLHLLDSRPLHETLSIFMNQRLRTLQSLFSRKLELPSLSNAHGGPGNGHVPEKLNVAKGQSPPSQGRRVRAVKQAILTVLDAVSRTMEAAREIFRDQPSQPSLIRRVLEHIQADPTASPTSTLPAELRLTSQTLLATLPSSGQFQLLPSELRSYKPYVDLSSSSSSVLPAQFDHKLEQWFEESSANFQNSIQQWFTELHLVKDVWKVRHSILKKLRSLPGLKNREVTRIHSLLDDASCLRIRAVRKTMLADASSAFSLQLNSMLQAVSGGLDSSYLDRHPAEFLFRAPPLPVTQTGLMSVDSFGKYKSMLCRQLEGRTTLLDEVLATLENCARSIRQDLSHITSGNADGTHRIFEQLSQSYQPDAQLLCSDVISHLRSSANEDTGTVFVGRIAKKLGTISSFASDVGCGDDAANGFREEMESLYEEVIEGWRQTTTNQLVRVYHDALLLLNRYPSSLIPSSPLVESLLSLSKAIQLLGLSHISWQDDIVNKTLHLFVVTLLEGITELHSLQLLCDLIYLQKVITSHEGCEELEEHLAKTISAVKSRLHSEPGILDELSLGQSVSDYFARTQTLISMFIHDPPGTPGNSATEPSEKSSPLIRHGPPNTEKFHPAFDVVSPITRFGLLLVGDVAVR